MKMRKITIILLYLIITLPVLYSQQMDIVWQKCLGTDINDTPKCIINTNNGFLTSTTIGKDSFGISNYHGGGDAWIVELGTLGNIIWEKCFGGSDGEGIKKIIKLPNNEYYLFGGTSSSDGDVQSNIHNSYDIWVVKIDSSRNIIWERCYGTYSNDSPNDAIATSDGGLLILGDITSSGGDISIFYGHTDAWLCRIDSLGNILWEKTYGNHGTEELWSITETSNNTFMLIGHYYESGGMIECDVDSSSMYKDVWIIEVDTNGNLINQFCYGGSYYEQGIDIIDVDDGYVMIASTNSNDKDVSGLNGTAGEFVQDFWIVKIDIYGSIVWQSCLGGTSIEEPYFINETHDSGFLVIGVTNSIDGDVVGNHNPYGERPDVWVVKINETGELQWQQCIGGYGFESITPHSILKLDDYNYAITAESNMLNGDVECAIDSSVYNATADAWVFQIKDCSQYQPTTPQKPTGKNYICVNTDSITTYSTQVANGAWYYEWKLLPENSGTITQDSISAQINWNPTFEGPATIKVRSSNDCGTSEWSDSLTVQTYMCLGSEEYNDRRTAFSIYPNPVSSKLTVSYYNQRSIKPLTIEVLDMYGTIVIKQDIPNGKQKLDIDVTNLVRSLYVLRVVENGEVVGVRKVVVE